MQMTTLNPNTPKKTTSVTIQAQATPYMVRLEIPQEQISESLVECWEKKKPTLTPKDWAGFRPGSDAARPIWEERVGLTNAYQPVWLNAISQGVATNKKFVLDVQEVAATRDKDVFIVAAVVFLMPEVKIAENFDKIPIELYSLHPSLIAKAVDEKIDNLVASHEVYATEDGGVVATGTRVKVSISAVLDGKPWPAGTVENKHFDIRPNTIFPEELGMGLIGKKAGDEFVVTCDHLPNIYGADAGKRFEGLVTVYEIQTKVSETRDAIFVRAGYESENQARSVLSVEVERNMREAQEGTKYELGMHFLRTHSTMDPVPMHWLRARATEEYKLLQDRFPGKTEEEILSLCGVSKSLDLTRRFMAQVADLLRDELTVLAFAAGHGKCDYTQSVTKNFEVAKEFMYSCFDVTEIEPLLVNTERKKLAVTGE